ncbi:MAG: PH domain-containing protein [Bacteroidota bacterium]|jgi:hypothetical protein
MGLLSSLMGNASEVNPKELENEFSNVLTEGESIEAAFKIFRDKWVFTNKRLIMQDVQGMTGSKKEYHTIPYKSITHFLVETAGTFDGDCEIEIWISGSPQSFKKELKKGIDVIGLQKTLATYICK